MFIDIDEFGLGFKILILGSPFYFVLAIDSLSNVITRSQGLDFTPLFPLWATIIITLAFFIGFFLMFTTREEELKTYE